MQAIKYISDAGIPEMKVIKGSQVSDDELLDAYSRAVIKVSEEVSPSVVHIIKYSGKKASSSDSADGAGPDFSFHLKVLLLPIAMLLRMPVKLK